LVVPTVQVLHPIQDVLDDPKSQLVLHDISAVKAVQAIRAHDALLLELLTDPSLFHVVAEGSDQAIFNSHNEAVETLEVVALGLGMKVVEGVLHSLLVAQVKLFFECLRQLVLDFSVFLKKVDADNEAVVVD
jgi:hypothetical protein